MFGLEHAYIVGLTYLSRVSKKVILSALLSFIVCSIVFAQHTITATAGAGGSIDPSGAVPVSDGADQSFTISPNSNYHVADVLVNGTSVGAVTSYTFNDVTGDSTIAASFAIDTYTIDASAGANGSISPMGAVSVDHGSNQTFTITPAANHHVADVVVDGGSVGAVTSHTFTNVTAEGHTIVASFAIDTYTIDASAGANGSISPTGAVSVDHGSDQSFTITPNTGYHVANVVVDGGSMGALTSYTFTNVTSEGHTIVASFAINTYTIDASAGANGSISPTGAVSVDHGSNQTFTITPAANHHVADVVVDGGSVGAVTSHTFTNVIAEGHTIVASFAIDTYTIDASAGANGSISPSGAVSVDHGSNQTFTITPAANHHVADVVVDGGSIGAVTSHTFTNVTAEGHTIVASFAIDTYTIDASAGANGSISPTGAVSVDHGSNQSFTITPITGYHVADVVVDGGSVGALTSYTFTNVTSEGHTIVASFAINTYTIDASAGANGSISPTGAVSVDHGSNQTFTITPAANHHVADVVVDGGSVGAVTSHTFTNVIAEGHTIVASFAIDTYSIDASAGANGSISPSGAVSVDHGSDQSFTITPNTGYHVADVVVDGGSVGAVTSHTFTNVIAEGHTIVASFAIDTYTIDASAGANGSISPTGAVSVNHGSNQTFTITPAANHHVADVVVDGGSVGAVTSHTFTNVIAEGHTIVASFAINTYTIDASAGANGSISPTGAVSVDHGSNQTFTITPAANHHVADVVVDGSSVGAVTSHTFTNVIAEGHTIVASFAIDTYTIDASAGANGSISPTGAVIVDHGSDQTFTITPAANHHVADVVVDGSSVGAVTSHTFTNVIAEGHTIAASFAIDTYTIDASAGANGSISPTGAVSVDHGSNQTFTITPAANHHVADVVVDGGSVGALTSYTFTNVTSEDHTIVASFAIDTYTIDASAGANGSISPTGAVSVDHGSNQTFTITPAANHHVADVVVDGGSVGAVTSHTFTNVIAEGHTIVASFAIDTYTIDASAGANGSISPTGAVIVDHGSNQTFTITPAANHHVADVVVDGGSVGAVTSHTFTNVIAEGHTIAASFAINTYTIDASAGANGSISPTGAVSVDHGSNQTFTITPAANHHVADVVVDGGSVGAVTSHTFTNVIAEGHTIAASFAIDTYTIDASAGANGSISPTGAVSVDHGSNQTFTITPAANHHVTDVFVDGSSVGAVTSHTFTNVIAEGHTIVASFAIDTYTITSSAGANGGISPLGPQVVDYGAILTFTITPNTGYHIADVLVDGTSVGALTSYSFTSIDDDHTIAASFAIDTYTIDASAGANGSISPTGAVSVDHGSNQTFTITPAANHHVADVFVDGSSVGAVTSHTFTNVIAEGHTIVASFAIDTYTIDASAGANGSISPSGAVSVDHGSNQTFTITPAANHHVADVVVDGGSVGAVTSHTFTNVTSEGHTIVASFAIDTYTIDASAGANGSISPSGAVSVDHGSDQTFTITPITGYHVADVFVDGGSVGALTSHTFTNVTAEGHTIVASFAINTYTITPIAGPNGTVEPSVPTEVNHGSDLTFVITPNTGYHVADVLVDASSVGAVTSYTFTNVIAGGHAIVASFAIDTYTIDASAGANGSISPTGAVIVDHGSDQTFTITPAANHHVADVFVDGGSVGAVTSHTFTNVIAEGHTIAASFAIDTYTIDASAGANGSISPTGAVIVDHGSDQTFTITPAANHHVADVFVDGGSVGAVTSHTFTNVIAEGHTIAASFAIDTYTIDASAGANGSISPTGAVSVDHGSNQTFTITPAANHHVTDVLVDGGSVGAVTSHTFTNVITEGHTIVASFAIDTYTIDASAGANGSISPTGAVSVDHGSNQTFTITPAANHHVADVVVDGSSVGAVTSHTFTNVIAEGHTIVASFAIDTFTIDASAGANGSISPSGAVIVDHGSDQTFTITPNTGYHIANVLVDGVSVGPVTSYSFTSIDDDHTIAASFAINTYTINASAGANGGISPSGTRIVNYGTDLTFTITPNTGYLIANVLVDGVSVGVVTSHSFTSIDDDHTISATFVKHIEVHSVTIPDATMKIGDVISATLTVITDVGLPYSIVSGSIGGYPLFNLQRISSTTYLANFIVTEGGPYYVPSQDIPVSNLVLTDGTVQSSSYDLPIVQNNDLLDGRVPVIGSMNIDPGTYKIGDVVGLNIDADGWNYVVHPASMLNGISVTESNISFSELGDGNYRITYIVQKGDNDVDFGELDASIILVKPSGNSNVPYSAIGNAGSLSIDAHVPVINRMEVQSIEVGPGRNVQVTITADGTGYAFAVGTIVNGVPLSSSRVTTSELTGGLYEVSYEVSFSDNAVIPGELQVRVIMNDPAGNQSISYSSLQSNTLEVYTTRPSGVLAGTPEICEGESADLSIFLQGRGPWRLGLSDGSNTTYFSSVEDSIFTVSVAPPQSAIYSIDLLRDRNLVYGSGSSNVELTVLEKTPVEISNLASGYSIEANPIELSADISGGVFSGPGVISTTGYFYPAIADTVNSPHTIYYHYTNPNGCISVDSNLVFVLGAQGDIYIPDEKVCYNSDPFLVNASNIAGANGSFKLLDSNNQDVTGLTDHGDNSATIDPALLGSGDYIIEFEYFDEVLLYLRTNFILESIPEPEFTNLRLVYCQNEIPVQLRTDDVNAIFEGPGVSGDVENGFIFDPGTANLGYNSIAYTVTTEAGCSRSVQQDVMVKYVPDVKFTTSSSCIPSEGGSVKFDNMTGDKTLVESWAWNFDDAGSGVSNFSNLIDPEHFYMEPGDRSIILTANTFEGCAASSVLDTTFGARPIAGFSWISDCFADNSSTQFVNRSDLSFSEVSSMIWTFYSGTGDSIGATSTTSLADTITYSFPETENYQIDLHIVNSEGCSDSIRKELVLRPFTQIDRIPYHESFNDTEAPWTVHSMNQVESWVWAEPEFNGYEQITGDKAWFTQLPSGEIGYIENSWIQSPCFNFSDLKQPMLQLDIMRSFVPLLNGAVLQYQDVYEEGWKTIGAKTTGINWYNSDIIINKPGGSHTGWGLDVFNPDTSWIRAYHDLDEIAGSPNVAFRIAVANNGAQGIGNQGFAFDNLLITERTKFGVLEYFTNSSDSTSGAMDQLIESLSIVKSNEIIDIQYHVDYPGSDPMNKNNPFPASTRSFYYGYPPVPYALINGGATDQNRFDLSTPETKFGENHLTQSTLEVPEFNVDLLVSWSEGSLEATTTVTSLTEEYSENIQLYVIVLETSVTSYSGENGNTQFRNVVLDMLPTPAGRLLGNEWGMDSSKTQVNTWTYPNYLEDMEDLAVVAFIQERNSGNILQSTVKYFDETVNTRNISLEAFSIHTYPNPAKNSFYVNLGNPSEQQGRFDLLDMNGKIVLTEMIPPGFQIYQVDIQQLNRGIYILHWYESGQFRGINKIVKTE